MGMGDLKTRRLRDAVHVALERLSVAYSLREVSDINAITLSGVVQTPALVVDGRILSEGFVPGVEEVFNLLSKAEHRRDKLTRLQKILVPVDGSETSGNALKYAWAFARGVGASIDVIHVLEGIYEGATSTGSGFLNSYVDQAKQDLDAFVAAVFEKSYPGELPGIAVGRGADAQVREHSLHRIHTEVVFGFPERVLEEASHSHDLLIMGTSGKSKLAAGLLGSVSVDMAKKAHCPVLLVPNFAQYTPYKRLLYASSFEHHDQEKVELVVKFAHNFDAEIHFVHVGMPKEPGEMLERSILEAEYLKAKPDKPFLFAKMIGDDVTEKIHEYAFEHKTDLSIFLSPRRGFWDNLFHRSQTRDMILHTHSPLLVLHQYDDIHHGGAP
jgi:nucleotide-binding universal stress UspA family protein